MSDEPAGMSGADQFRMNMANQAGQGGDGSSGIFGIFERFLGSNLANGQGGALPEFNFMGKNIPSIMEMGLTIRSWSGGWLDDLIQRISGPATDGSGGVDTSGGGGGGGGEISAPTDHGDGGGGGGIQLGGGAHFESVDMGAPDISAPKIPDMGGHSQQHIDI